MSAPVKLSEAASLAIHACLWLSSDPETYHPTREICGDLHCSQAHLAKVVQALARASLIDSQRGPSGGVRLAHPPSQTTLLAIYEAIEGPTVATGCLLPAAVCPGKACVIGKAISDLNRQFITLLQETNLAGIRHHLRKGKA